MFPETTECGDGFAFVFRPLMCFQRPLNVVMVLLLSSGHNCFQQPLSVILFLVFASRPQVCFQWPHIVSHTGQDGVPPTQALHVN